MSKRRKKTCPNCKTKSVPSEPTQPQGVLGFATKGWFCVNCGHFVKDKPNEKAD